MTRAATITIILLMLLSTLLACQVITLATTRPAQCTTCGERG